MPGVGKTHNYKRLISLIESGEDEKTIFDEICKNDLAKKTYDEYESAQRENRVEFVTFHQSYSYEEFIEGLRPQADGQIEIEDGIFKRFCKKAKNEQDKNFFFDLRNENS